MTPSNSTLASASIGTSAAIILAWIGGQFHLQMTPEVIAALGSLISTIAGYPFAGGKKTDTAAASPQAGFVRISFAALLAVLAFAMMSLLNGCVTNPTTGQQELSATGKVAIQEVAGIAVGRLLRESAHATEVAARVRSVAMELQSATDTLSVADLTAKLDKRIDEKVSDPYDRSDLHRLLNLSSALLQDYVGQGQLKPEDLVKVSEFMGYVIAALPPPLTRT